jgi:predicted metal-dependent hydrolase
MRASLKFFIDGVGEVLVERSRRARRMSISVRPSRVRVAVPVGISLSRGKDFAYANSGWIGRHLRRLESLARTQAGKACNLPPMTDRETARKKIIVRLDELAAQHGLPYTHVSVRNQKTHWGSCSMRGAISLNINLARLPVKLMDYVIIHELLHTKIKGHGKDFWQRLDTLVGDACWLRKELRKYSFTLLQSR